MYHYIIGASAGGLLFAYGLYQSCFKNKSSNRRQDLSLPTQTPAESAHALREALLSSGETNFESFVNTIGRTIDLFKLWPSKLDEQGIWRLSSTVSQLKILEAVLNVKREDSAFKAILESPRHFESQFDPVTMVCVLKLHLEKDAKATFSRYNFTAELRENLVAAQNDAAATSDVICQHLRRLIISGHIREAFVLHNLFHLLKMVDRHSSANLMPVNNLVVPLMPWVGTWLGFPEATRYEEIGERRTLMENIIPRLINAPLFDKSFEESFSSSLYQECRPHRAMRAMS